MDKIELLEKINLGNSVAEYDKNLANYFIDTNYVEELVSDKYDIVKGVKGAGKTAMLVALLEKQTNYKQLENVKLVQAINLKGDPDFKRAFNDVSDEINEQNLIDSWKIYIVNLIWKNINDTHYGFEELEKYLKDHNLISNTPSLLGKILHAFNPKLSNTFNTDGTITQSLELTKQDTKYQDQSIHSIIDFNYIFSQIDKILIEKDFRVWVMMDRLDDAFPDKTQKSIKALKSLLYAYKDISVYENLKIKILIRDDIYINITEKGFTSLTHVASKALNPIKWDKNKLAQLLVERLLFNEEFKEYLRDKEITYTDLNEERRNIILEVFFRKQVDTGKKNPDTLGWIINHITDGQSIFTPRDLVNLIDKARQSQIVEWKLNNKSSDADYLIGATAIRNAYKELSREKLETQLYAEYPDLRKYIEKFKDSKAEHNEESLKMLLGKRWKSNIKKLVECGFIEEKNNTWKVPFLYREGLNISQGKVY